MVSGSLALLYCFSYSFLFSYFNGSRAAAPVGGDFPSVRLSVSLSVMTINQDFRASWEGLGSSWEGLEAS